MIAGAIADDLTGAVELAGMLAAGGARVALVTHPGDVTTAAIDRDVVVVALRSRVAPVNQAVESFRAAAAMLLAGGARHLFFKYCATFDSTPDGNIGPCADLLDELTGGAGTMFCPSFPEPRRTVYLGHHFVGDQLLSESPKRDDPLTPMNESDLVKVLQTQTNQRVGLMSWPIVSQGAAAIAAEWERLRAAGIGYAIADAITESDLEAIATATVDWSLMTGGSSVAAYYPALWRARGWIADPVAHPLPRNDGPAIVLAGSCAGRTLDQIAAFGRTHPVLTLDIGGERTDRELIAEAVTWAERQPGPACIATSADPATIAAVQARIGRDAAARRAETVLASIARMLLGQGRRRFVVAGGETSGAVIEALGIRQLAVAPFAQLGVGLCFAEAPAKISLCLKSGKLGAVDLFETALRRMEG